jgi:putative transposase
MATRASGRGAWRRNDVASDAGGGHLLQREGVAMNKKKLFRLYREKGWAVRRRRGRKRASGTRAPVALPDGPNQRWSLDFVADACRGGADSGSCASTTSPARSWPLVMDTSIGGRRLARELDILIALRGRPATIVSDNGTEMTSRPILEWTNPTGVDWHYIAPGSRSRMASSRASTGACATSA